MDNGLCCSFGNGNWEIAIRKWGLGIGNWTIGRRLKYICFMKKIIYALILSSGMLSSAFAQSGYPDVTFGGTGIVQIMNFIGSANAVAVQQDGKILIGGYWEDTIGFQNYAIARFLDDGTLDSTFDNDGIMQSPNPGIIHSLVIQPDNKIVAGYSNITGVSRFNIIRILDDGNPDTSFGNSGLVNIPLIFTDIKCYGVTLQPGGEIVATGFGSSGIAADSIIVARLHADGRPDSTFNNDGIGIYGVNSFSQGRDVTIQPDNKILITGSPSFIMRLTTDGLPDSSFAGTGVLQVNQPGFNTSYSVILLPDEKIFFGGDQYIVKLESNGSPDTSFGTNGYTNTQNIIGSDMALQPDGKIIFAGSISGIVGTDIAIARYLANGTIDLNFGLTGITVVDIGGNDHATSVALQPDGKIVLTSLQPVTLHFMNCIRLENDPFLSVDEIDIADRFIFPNPATEWIRISGGDQTSVRIRVSNLLGEILLESSIHLSSEKIDVSSLKAGIYILDVFTGSQVRSHKFIRY